MNLDSFLQSFREGYSGEEGGFTLAADRAKRLLAERNLADVWTAWLCLAQGLLKIAPDHRIIINNTLVEWRVNTNRSLTLAELLEDERALLGWLNLDWFGQPSWSEQTFSLKWKGGYWRRSRCVRNLSEMLKRALSYPRGSVAFQVGGFARVAWSQEPEELPPRVPLCLFPCSADAEGALAFVSPGTLTSRFCRVFDLGWPKEVASVTSTIYQLNWPGGDKFDSPCLWVAAIAGKTRTSWSEVTWVHRGVVIKTERNTLERPGVLVVASVDALGLKTDLSGFSVVHDEAYFRFVNQLKRDVLWML